MDVNQLITEHLDIWCTATERKASVGRGKGDAISLHGIKKLRELILELAIRGKLVEQDESEGAAIDLLAQSERAKKKGHRDKIYKKQNLGTKLDKSDELFELPQNWTWARLGEIGFIYNGNSVNAKAKSEKYSDQSGLPFVATKNVGYGFEPIDYNVDAWIPEGEPKFKLARPNTPLICSEGGSAGKKCGMTDQDVYFGNKLFACQFYDEFIPSFLLILYQSPSFFAEFSRNMTGIIGGISLAKFVRLPVPVPPMAEQVRIVAKVEQLMKLCDALETQTADGLRAHQILVETCLGTLTNSSSEEEFTDAWERIQDHFDTLFTTEESLASLEESILDLALSGKLVHHEAAENVVGSKSHGSRNARDKFQRFDLSDLLEFGPKNGFSPRAVDHETEIKTLTLTATTSGTFDGSHFKYVDIERPAESSELWLRNGDILVQRANALNYVGVSALFDGPENTYIYPDLMIKFRVNELISNDYMMLCLRSKEVRAYFRENATGTSGSMPKINHGVLKRTPIWVPSHEIQKRTVSFISQIGSVIEMIKSQIERSSKLSRISADTLTSKIH